MLIRESQCTRRVTLSQCEAGRGLYIEHHPAQIYGVAAYDKLLPQIPVRPIRHQVDQPFSVQRVELGEHCRM